MGNKSVVAHSRWIAPNSSYIRTNPELDWVVSPKAALARNFQAFYELIMGHARDVFSMNVYEQDWTGSNYYNNPWLQETLGESQRWLTEMGLAASGLGLSVAYGTVAGSADALAALEVPAATFMLV